MTAPGDPVADRVRRAADRLERAGIESGSHDAWALLAACAEIPQATLRLGSASLDDATWNRFDEGIERRARRIPLQHLVGTAGFHAVELETPPGVFVPRADTESLVEVVVGICTGRGLAAPRLLDLGTGTGAVAVALARSIPGAWIAAVDRSPPAVGTTRRNARRNGVRVHPVLGDGLSAMGPGRLDGLVSNPPYIRTGDLAGLEPEVRDHDPRLALDGGPDGLDWYRRLASAGADALGPRGFLAVEIGWDQADDVRAILERAGWRSIAVHPDLGGRPRVVVADRG